MNKKIPWNLVIPVSIVLLNFLIKGIFLAHNSVAGDEPFSIYHAQMDVISIIKQLSMGNNPPLFEIILHFWIKIFGISAFSVRFPSLLFSCITALYIYKIGINYFDKRIAVYSSLLFVFSNYQILFAHEARVYALMGMLTAISMFYYLELVATNRGNRWKFIIFLITNIVLIYSHYFGFFVLFIQFLHIVTDRKLRNNYWKKLLLSIGILAFFYSPNIVVFIHRFIDSSTNGTWIQPPNGLGSIYDMLRQFTNAPVLTVIATLILLISGSRYFIKNKPGNLSLAQRLILLWFVFPFFFMFFISFWIPMFFDRYLMFVSISFYLLVVIAIDFLTEQRVWRYSISFILCILFIVTVNPNMSNKRNVKEAVTKIVELKNTNTIVYFCPSWFEMNFVYYYNIECFMDYDNKDIKRNMYTCLHNENVFPIDNQNQIDTTLIQQADKVIFLDAGADFSFPGNNIQNTLNRNCKLKNKFEFYEIFTVYEYGLK